MTPTGGTPLILGPIFEKIFDKVRSSREKLAWILDSMMSPVAVLIPFIGWLAWFALVFLGLGAIAAPMLGRFAGFAARG